MNKNLAFVVIGSLAGIGLIGAITLHLLRPDASATFIQSVIQILGLIIVASGLGTAVNKVADKVEAVRTQTNGTLSKKEAEINRLTRKLIENGIDPEIPQHRE